MWLSDTSVKRPVFASVVNVLLVTTGVVAFSALSLREYPAIDPPIVSVNTTYTGAAAPIVERRITQKIEDVLSGVEGLETISSTSTNGVSSVQLEFSIDRNVDDAANDVRDRIARVLDELPDEAESPEISKVDSDANVIVWFNLQSNVMNAMELTDYARRVLVDRFSVLPGVARIFVGGSQQYALRIWLDPVRLAAFGLVPQDVEDALRRENIELPAGRIDSPDREYSIRLVRGYRDPEAFRSLVLRAAEDGGRLTLGDVAEVAIGPSNTRVYFHGNGEPMIGVGIVKQSTANTLEVARAAKAEAKRIQNDLPTGTTLHQSYDSSLFIEWSLFEVYKTLLFAVLLVVVVLFLFLGDPFATLIPAITVPIAVAGSFTALWWFGFSINVFTLLALVLSIGLVVDDTIVVTENIARRIGNGESPLHAAYFGTREVGFAVIATTLVLLAVFAPIAFLTGNVGRLFVEFAVTMSAAVVCSSFVALTLAPVLAAALLRPHSQRPHGWIAGFQKRIAVMQQGYGRLIQRVQHQPLRNLGVAVLLTALGGAVFWWIPREFAPREDRGAFFVRVQAPEGTSFTRMREQMQAVENDMLTLLDSDEAIRVLARVPGDFRGTDIANSGIGIVLLKPWNERTRSGQEVTADLQQRFNKHTDVRAFAIMRQGLSRGRGRPVSFVIGGPTYEELAQWRDTLREHLDELPELAGVEFDYRETQPQYEATIDREQSAALGVSFEQVARTLETLFASRKVTTFQLRGEEYDVILEAPSALRQSIDDLNRVYVRSNKGALVPIANVVHFKPTAGATELRRFDRKRALTLEANLAPGATLGDALGSLQSVARRLLPDDALFNYKGESREYQQASRSVAIAFALAIFIAFLVLAAQFESVIHPLVIMLVVPLAVVSALAGLFVAGNSLNIYSQIGMVMLIGLAAKNGILVVEFINQLRDRGVPFDEAIPKASALRLRPILMTGLSTAAGAIPLVWSSGAGAETRLTIGLVILFGVMGATVCTVWLVPTAYAFLAKRTGSPESRAQRIAEGEPRAA